MCAPAGGREREACPGPPPGVAFWREGYDPDRVSPFLLLTPTVPQHHGPGNETTQDHPIYRPCMCLQSTYYALESVPARVSAKALPLVVPSGVGEARPSLRSLQRQAPTACRRARGPSSWWGYRKVCERVCTGPGAPSSLRHARCPRAALHPGGATFSSHSSARGRGRRCRQGGGSPARLLRVLVLAVRLQGRVHLLPQRLHLGRVREPLGV